MGRLLAKYPSDTMYQETEKDIHDLTFIEQIEDNCPHSLYLDFYGHLVCVRTHSIAMKLEFEFIFEMFCTSSNTKESTLEFFFLIEENSNELIEQHKKVKNLTWTIANYYHDDLVKAIYRKSNNKFTRLQRYDKWPTDKMVIPPFNIEPLKNNFLVIEGNALISPEGKVCLILGGWWQGKTTLTALLLKMGYLFLSDGLIVIDRETRMVKPYSTLCAFRYYNIPELGDLGNAIINHPKTIQVESPNTGLIYLNHFSSFFPITLSKTSYPSFIAICERNKALTSFIDLDLENFILKAWEFRVECGLDRNEFFQEMLSLYKETNCFSLIYSNLSEGALVLDNAFMGSPTYS